MVLECLWVILCLLKDLLHNGVCHNTLAGTDQNQYEPNSGEYSSPQLQDHASPAREFVLVFLRLVEKTRPVGT